MPVKLTFCAILIAKLLLFNSNLARADFKPDSKTTRFWFAAGAAASVGTIGNKTNSIKVRNMTTGSIFAQVGLKSGFVIPYLYGELAQSEQSTEASTVDNTNMSGLSQLAGLGLRLNMGAVYLSGTYIPIGQYALSRSTASNENSIYIEPMGYVVHAGFTVNWMNFFIQFKQIEYSKQRVGNRITDLGDNKILQQDAGAGFQGGLTWAF